MRVLLPTDEPSRQQAVVNIAFFSAATVTPSYAGMLRDGYAPLLAIGPVLIGQFGAGDALAILDHTLDRSFR